MSGIRRIAARAIDGGDEVDFALDEGATAFRGHFPDGAVLPAIGHLFLVEAALREVTGSRPALTVVEQARFLAPVRPGDLVTVRLARADRTARFEVRSGGRNASEGSVRWDAAPGRGAPS